MDGNDASTNVDRKRDEENEERDYEQCGFQIGCGSCKSKRWRLPIFNRLNNTKGALFFWCCVVVVQGFIVNGMINVVITTLEKRSTRYDIAICICILFVTYIGGHGHKPLWIGWGAVLMGIGSIVFSLPHFIAPRYDVNKLQIKPCGNDTCENSNICAYRGFFIVAQLLLGMGATPLFTLAVTYLDENVRQKYSSVYHGIYFGVSVIGPAAGFMAGAEILGTFTNIGEKVDITYLDALWVGNWWIGFLVGGVCFIVFAIPILLYPRQIPGTDEVRRNRENEMYKNEDHMARRGDEKFGKSFKDAPRSVLILLKNPTIVFLSLADAMDNGIIAGISTFGPKYIESMFTLPITKAALYFGISAIFTASLGQLFGGLIVWKFKLNVPKMIIMCMISTVFSFGCFFMYSYHCDNIRLAGVNVPYPLETDINCNMKCGGCTTARFDPVCGNDSLTYMSYCDAGCPYGNTVFSPCLRVFQSGAIPYAIRGRCTPGPCTQLPLFIIISGIGAFFIFLNAQPGIQASLRCVLFNQRSFALGFQWLVVRVLGTIPAPIILGRVLDLTCSVWGEECGECGNCKLYDHPRMAWNMVIVATVSKAVSFIFYLLAWLTYKPPPEIKEEQNQGEGSANGQPRPGQTTEAYENKGFSAI